ncbi:uncharacterized protein PHACADRAFT_201118 [Phanerochaete carnosa HHB-10118-sp]|uniref:Uncharacterized protein n=1 Tax=Phanerochaete carnosa (strain HHB-10118-sp) TaxID=650164 RepID=K5VUL7_PHACS|nr:uncharacterized protein PHACADRAFT_201118 [Phanerochaete carnosa HHB-10118-sp]EKM50279.1 hypothetical protein PHACADRAFT_201118 [Phanerochaete carnosa HHB-10118-sp]
MSDKHAAAVVKLNVKVRPRHIPHFAGHNVTLEDLYALEESVEWLDRLLAALHDLALDAPPDLRGVAQRNLVTISDLHVEKESEWDRVAAELYGADPSDHDSYATETDVEEDGQLSDEGSSHDGDSDSDDDGDDDTGDVQGQFLPVRLHLSPPPEHREYRVMSPPPTFLENRALVRPSPGQPSSAFAFNGQAPRDNDVRRGTCTVVSTVVQFASHRTTLNTTEQGAALSRNHHLRYDAPLGRADHVSAPLTTSGYRALSHRQPWTHAPKTDNQRGKKRSLEVEEVKEEEVGGEPRKRHAANKENVAAGPSEDDDDDRAHEGPRPKRSRPSPVRPSFCHPSRHVENRDRARAAGAASVQTAAPAAVVASPPPTPAAPVVVPVPAVAALAAQPAQGAFVVIPPPPAAPALPAPTYLPPIVQVLAGLPNPP